MDDQELIYGIYFRGEETLFCEKGLDNGLH